MSEVPRLKRVPGDTWMQAPATVITAGRMQSEEPN
jgi:hypothetical protein